MGVEGGSVHPHSYVYQHQSFQPKVCTVVADIKTRASHVTQPLPPKPKPFHAFPQQLKSSRLFTLWPLAITHSLSVCVCVMPITPNTGDRSLVHQVPCILEVTSVMNLQFGLVFEVTDSKV